MTCKVVQMASSSNTARENSLVTSAKVISTVFDIFYYNLELRLLAVFILRALALLMSSCCCYLRANHLSAKLCA